MVVAFTGGAYYEELLLSPDEMMRRYVLPAYWDQCQSGDMDDYGTDNPLTLRRIQVSIEQSTRDLSTPGAL